MTRDKMPIVRGADPTILQLVNQSPPSPDVHRDAHAHEEFSLPLFAATVLGSLAAVLLTLRLVAPEVWSQQWTASFGAGLLVFAVVSLFICFVEFFFHRYVLHTPAIPFVRRLYRQHTLHHALTRIARRPSRNGSGILFIENKFPIVEPEQTEASFFPWYTLGVFALLLTPLFAFLHWVAPGYPWFLGGFAALASSLTLYELLHAINHWPFEKWEPLLMHPRWSRFWRPLYGFHLRHHAVIDCNESVSGFFGLPVADWVFGTCIIPQSVYAAGEVATPEKFASPRPRAFIRWLDERAKRAVEHRRETTQTRAEVPANEPARAATTAEQVAVWVTHGAGLLVSLASFTLLIVFASLRGDAWHVVTFTVFGLALLALYAVAFLSRIPRSGRMVELTRRLGRVAAFVLIAATYTPLLLTNHRGPWGWTLFGVIWGLCGAAALFQLFAGERRRIVSAIAVAFAAWTTVVTIRPLLAAISPGALWLLLAGGACYLLATAFAKWHRVKFQGSIQHLFVLGGSTCHVLALLLFHLPAR